jgi:hypothetical protein
MLTTKCFHYNARQKWTARAGVKSMRCEMGNEGGKSQEEKRKRRMSMFLTCMCHDFIDQVPIDCAAVIIWG